MTKLKPKNEYQADYIRTVAENDITFCVGPAGSGKSAIAIGLACEKFLAGNIEQIIFTKPFVNAGKGIGFLKGDLKEKCEPYFFSALDEFDKYFDRKDLEKLRKDKKIRLEPLELMRGSNFYDSYLIGSEMQNATYEQIRMFVTRMGYGSKCIVEGDVKQCDLYQYRQECDFIDFVTHFKKKQVNKIAVAELPFDSIVRSPIIGTFLRETDEWTEE